MIENKSAAIRVLIVDDHEMVRKGLSLFIRSYDDFELVGEAANGRTAKTLCDQLQPDVVLMDLIMPEGDGIRAIYDIHEQWPWIKLIALTSFRDEQLIARALSAGAIGFLYKDIGTKELFTAIRHAYEGRPMISLDASQALLRMWDKNPHSQVIELSQNERQILILLAQGLTNRQIATYMQVSPASIKQILGVIFAKLGVNSRIEAVSRALQIGL